MNNKRQIREIFLGVRMIFNRLVDENSEVLMNSLHCLLKYITAVAQVYFSGLI